MTKPLNEKKILLKENGVLSSFLLLYEYTAQNKEKEFLKDIGLKKKKKVSTYLDDWDVFLKALIDLEININIVADFCNMTEILINVLPEIKKITNNLEEFIHLSRTYNFLKENFEYELDLYKKMYPLHSPEELEIEESEEALQLKEVDKDLDTSMHEYNSYIEKISNFYSLLFTKNMQESFKKLVLSSNKNNKYFNEIFNEYIVFKSFVSTYREILIIYDNFLNNDLEITEEFDFDYEPAKLYKKYFFITDNSSDLRRKITRQLESIKNFPKKEAANIKKEILAILEKGEFKYEQSFKK